MEREVICPHCYEKHKYNIQYNIYRCHYCNTRFSRYGEDGMFWEERKKKFGGIKCWYIANGFDIGDVESNYVS